MLTNFYVCVCVCVQCSKIKDNFDYHYRCRTAILTSREYMMSLKSCCARRSVIHSIIHPHTDMQIQWTQTRVHKGTSKNQHTHKQIHSSSRLWTLLFVLLVSMPPNSYSGACAMHVPNLVLTRKLSHVIPPLSILISCSVHPA